MYVDRSASFADVWAARFDPLDQPVSADPDPKTKNQGTTSMTEHPIPDMSTLDARRNSASFSISKDGLSYECTRVFGAPPERIFKAFTDPADIRVWFPSGAPDGSEMTLCESNAVEGGHYRYAMVVPGHGPMAWHGTYTRVDKPAALDANEWFVMGTAEPTGSPAAQTLTFDPTASAPR